MPFNNDTVAPALSSDELTALLKVESDKKKIAEAKAVKDRIYAAARASCDEGVALKLLSVLARLKQSAPWFGDDGIRANLMALWKQKCQETGRNGWRKNESPFTYRWTPSTDPIPLPEEMERPMKWNPETEELEEVVFTEKGLAGKQFCEFVRDAAGFENDGIWFGLFKIKDTDDFLVILDFIDGQQCLWGGMRDDSRGGNGKGGKGGKGKTGRGKGANRR